MASTASMIFRRGEAQRARSSSMSAKRALSWWLAWKPTLVTPGMRPKWFFTAPVMVMKVWVFILHRFHMPSQLAAGVMTWALRRTLPSGRETWRADRS